MKEGIIEMIKDRYPVREVLSTYGISDAQYRRIQRYAISCGMINKRKRVSNLESRSKARNEEQEIVEIMNSASTEDTLGTTMDTSFDFHSPSSNWYQDLLGTTDKLLNPSGENCQNAISNNSTSNQDTNDGSLDNLLKILYEHDTALDATQTEPEIPPKTNDIFTQNIDVEFCNFLNTFLDF
jgi:hypothetical protein